MTKKQITPKAKISLFVTIKLYIKLYSQILKYSKEKTEMVNNFSPSSGLNSIFPNKILVLE